MTVKSLNDQIFQLCDDKETPQIYLLILKTLNLELFQTITHQITFFRIVLDVTSKSSTVRLFFINIFIAIF
jgi:hypothetical protein